jgi:hypothetical protein
MQQFEAVLSFGQSIPGWRWSAGWRINKPGQINRTGSKEVGAA